MLQIVFKTCHIHHSFPRHQSCAEAPAYAQIFYFFYKAAKKARFSPNYGCDEGKCGSCELKVNGKTKIRPCIGKVPAAGPVILTEP